MKLAKVMQVFEKGDKYDLSKYTPILLFSKIEKNVVILIFYMIIA